VIRRLAILAALTVAGLSLFAGTSSARSEGKCIPNKQAGVFIVNKTAVLVYCGTAKMSIKSNGKTTRYAGGACYKLVGTLNVGMGKWTTIGHAPLYSAVLLVLPAPGDGTYRIGVITIQKKGRPTLAANHVKAVVKAHRSKGTFSGKFLKGAKFTGSFTCG
jgi:hypothetical protein